MGVKRGLVSCSGNTLNFSYDLKHRQRSLYGLHPEYLKEFASRIHCPHLLIKVREADNGDIGELNNSILDIYRRNKKFRYVEVEGSHHVHLNHPERVAPYMSQLMQ